MKLWNFKQNVFAWVCQMSTFISARWVQVGFWSGDWVGYFSTRIFWDSSQRLQQLWCVFVTTLEDLVISFLANASKLFSKLFLVIYKVESLLVVGAAGRIKRFSKNTGTIYYRVISRQTDSLQRSTLERRLEYVLIQKKKQNLEVRLARWVIGECLFVRPSWLDIENRLSSNGRNGVRAILRNYAADLTDSDVFGQWCIGTREKLYSDGSFSKTRASAILLKTLRPSSSAWSWLPAKEVGH